MAKRRILGRAGSMGEPDFMVRKRVFSSSKEEGDI